MLVFAWFPKVKWQLTDEKNGLEYIQTEMSQSQNMPQMRQNTVFYDASGRKEAVHEETLSRTT